MPITVLVADSKGSVRAACARILKPEKGIQIVGEAGSASQALAAAMKYKPKVLLLDLALAQPARGSSMLSAISRNLPRTTVILLTSGSSENRILEALCCGARGFIVTKKLRNFLPKAVRVVHAGEAWVPRKMVAKIIDRLVRLSRKG